jgi:TRAP-type mannitol/chloroaromatic compound transport system permease small subunit
LPSPLWPIKAIVTLGFIGLLLQQVVQLVHAFNVITGLTVDSSKEEYIPGSTV